MIDINTLREYYNKKRVFMSQHASNRCIERGITQKDIKHCIMTGEIIEQYPEDFPWPSCLIFGYGEKNIILHVVASDNGEFSKIITAYIPDSTKFKDDLKTRRERD